MTEQESKALPATTQSLLVAPPKPAGLPAVVTHICKCVSSESLKHEDCYEFEASLGYMLSLRPA